jgi:hypothetical protein
MRQPGQAEVAAHNMVSAPAGRWPYLATPVFWSAQFGTNIKSVGVPAFVRYESPVHMLPYRATLADIDIAGTTIPDGSVVSLMLAAGSRYPAASRTRTASPQTVPTTSTWVTAAASTTASVPRWTASVPRWTASVPRWPGWRRKWRCPNWRADW